jgi:hypothetical protein
VSEATAPDAGPAPGGYISPAYSTPADGSPRRFTSSQVVRRIGRSPYPFFIRHRLRIRIAQRRVRDASGIHRLGLVVYLSNLPSWIEKHLEVRAVVTQIDPSTTVSINLHSLGIDSSKLRLDSSTFVAYDSEEAKVGAGFAGPIESTLDSADDAAFLLFESAEDQDRVRFHGSINPGGREHPSWNQFFELRRDFRFKLRILAKERGTPSKWVHARRHYGVIFREWDTPVIGREVDGGWNRINLWDVGNEPTYTGSRSVVTTASPRRWVDDTFGPYP